MPTARVGGCVYPHSLRNAWWLPGATTGIFSEERGGRTERPGALMERIARLLRSDCVVAPTELAGSSTGKYRDYTRSRVPRRASSRSESTPHSRTIRTRRGDGRSTFSFAETWPIPDKNVRAGVRRRVGCWPMRGMKRSTRAHRSPRAALSAELKPFRPSIHVQAQGALHVKEVERRRGPAT